MLGEESVESTLFMAYIIVWGISLLTMLWVYHDATERVGKDGKIYGLTPNHWMAMILLFSFIGLIVYLLVHKNTQKYKRGRDFKRNKKHKQKSG
ncbi:MAG: hypothetical protein Q7J68_07105 [Thermoplasmata archaeon]|nr:hypothetical protein [Thermoplasmata archaeon]